MPAAEHSFLADPMRRFVQHKRALNRKYVGEERSLRLFDRYLAQQGATTWEHIDPNLVDRFLQSRQRARPRSHNHLRGVLRRFFAWAVAQRLTATNPVVARPRPVTSRRIPYLFDLSDMRRLLAVVRELPDNGGSRRRALVYETVFVLLWGLGLRVSEAVKLRVGDADFGRSALVIRDSKFGKSRLVPMGPRLTRRLAAYVKTVHGAEGDPQAPLFSFSAGRGLHPGTVSHTFHALVPELGLTVPPGVAAPRLHDLRHAFACNTLLRWYRAGIKPQDRRLQQSTFLGHVSPSSTAVYLTMTQELLAEADRRFRDFARPEGVA